MTALIRQQQKDGTWLEQKNFEFISRSESPPGAEKEKCAPGKAHSKIAADNDDYNVNYHHMTDQSEVNVIEVNETNIVHDDSNPFAIDALPPVFRNLTESMAAAYSGEDKMGMIALPMIGTLAACLGQGIVVKTEQFRDSYANLFIYLEGPTGSIKTIAYEEAMRPVEDYQQRSLISFHSEERPMMVRALQRIEEEISLAEDEENNEKALKELFRKKAALESQLVFCPVFQEDSTTEAMVDHGIRHSRVFISSDEASVVSDILLGRYSKGFNNDGPFCRMFSSGRLTRHRVGHNESYKYNQHVTGSMLLLGQEHITVQLFRNPDLVKSGFIPRFLFDSIESPMVPRDRTRPKIVGEYREAYGAVIKKALTDYWPITHHKEKLVTHVRMTSDGEDALDRFHGSYCDRGNSTLFAAKGTLQRIWENAARLSLVFHVAKAFGSGYDVTSTEFESRVSESTVLDAIKVVDWSLQNYLKFLDVNSGGEVSDNEKYVLGKAQELGRFTFRELQRKCRDTRIAGASHLRSILSVLIQKNRITDQQDGRYAAI